MILEPLNRKAVSISKIPNAREPELSFERYIVVKAYDAVARLD